MTRYVILLLNILDKLRKVGVTDLFKSFQLDSFLIARIKDHNGKVLTTHRTSWLIF